MRAVSSAIAERLQALRCSHVGFPTPRAFVGQEFCVGADALVRPSEANFAPLSVRWKSGPSGPRHAGFLERGALAPSDNHHPGKAAGRWPTQARLWLEWDSRAPGTPHTFSTAFFPLL